MPLSRDIEEVADQVVTVPRHQFRNHFVAQPPEKVLIAGEEPAVKKRDAEFQVVAVKPAALGKGSGRVSNAEPQVPQGSRHRGHGLAKRLRNPAAFGKEKQVDIRIREQFLPSIAADGDQAKITGPGWIWGEQVPVELRDDFVDQRRTLLGRG